MNTTTTDSSTNGSTNGSAKRAPREVKAPNPFDVAAKISKLLSPFSPAVRKSVLAFVADNDVVASVDSTPSDEQA